MPVPYILGSYAALGKKGKILLIFSSLRYTLSQKVNSYPKGQRKVILETLSVLEKARKPGEVWHLPFTWPEEPKKTDWQPSKMSPLIKRYLDEIRAARKS